MREWLRLSRSLYPAACLYECAYGTGVTVIEWADRAEAALPPECIIIYLEHIEENSRRLTFKACGEAYEKILQKLIQALEGGS